MALNATDVPTGTIELDLLPLMLQTIIAIAVSVGGGTFLGYHLVERSRKNKEDEDLSKIKKLLKRDFERLNNLSVLFIKDMLDFIEDMKNDSFIVGQLTSIEKVSAYSLHYIRSFQFVYWDVLSYSGKLIKLTENEISQIYSAYELITGTTSRIEKYNEIDVAGLKKIVQSTADLPAKKLAYKELLITSTHSILYEYELVYDHFQNMTISWIDKKQLSSENKQKLDKIIKNYLQKVSEASKRIV